MKFRRALVVALLALMVVPALSADVLFHVPWGTQPGQIGFYNGTTPGFDQPYSEGPGGLALGPNGEIWISDQWNDRILVFSRQGQFLRAVNQIAGQKIVRPKALWMDGERELIVLSGQTNALTRYDVKANTSTHVGGGSGGPGKLSQPELFGISMDKVCVQDDWKSELVCFARDGGVTRRPWVLGGLGVDGQGGVYTIEFRQNGASSSSVLVSTTPDGKKTDRYTLKPPAGESATSLTEPSLVGLDASGGAVVRFTKQGSPTFVLARYDAQGNPTRRLGELPVSVTRQAFVVTPDGGVVALAFDANIAPRGAVQVVEMR